MYIGGYPIRAELRQRITSKGDWVRKTPKGLQAEKAIDADKAKAVRSKDANPGHRLLCVPFECWPCVPAAVCAL